jgi:hypothetical protein
LPAALNNCVEFFDTKNKGTGVPDLIYESQDGFVICAELRKRLNVMPGRWPFLL